MKIINSFLLITLLVTSISFSQNEGKNFIDQPYIEVTGEIETEIIPNEIYLNITLNENDKKGKLSVEEQEQQMIAVLKSLKIDLEKNFSILDFNGFYQRKFLAENEVTKIKRYELIVNDGKTLGMVYEALDRIDISNITIAKTDHSDIENIKRETKLKALKVAKEKAMDYAKVIDQSIGKALYIQEINNGDINIMERVANGIIAKGYSNYEETNNMKIENLNFKPIIVSSTVLARFALN